MKILIGVLAAALLLASEASAQSTTTAAPAAPAATPLPSQCPPVPAAPAMPSGDHITAAQMTAANTAYNQWVAQAQTSLTCINNEFAVARATVNARFADNHAVVQQATDEQAAYSAAMTSFCAHNHTPSCAAMAHSSSGGAAH